MPSIDEIFGDLGRDFNKVADLAQIPANQREVFLDALTEWYCGATDGLRHDTLSYWDKLSDAERRKIGRIRTDLVSAANAAHALTPAQRNCVDTAGAFCGRRDWVRSLDALVMTLDVATARCRPSAQALSGIVKRFGGSLPSNDHSPDGVTLNKIIALLQPHFRKRDLRTVSASTFRRYRK